MVQNILPTNAKKASGKFEVNVQECTVPVKIFSHIYSTVFHEFVYKKPSTWSVEVYETWCIPYFCTDERLESFYRI